MKKYLISTGLLYLIGCTTTPVYDRQGYSVPANPIKAKSCQVPIQFDSKTKDKMIIGKIEAKEPIFGTHCYEEMVLNQFQADACQLGANLVNIVEEHQPDYFWNACYRAKAELLRVKNASSLKTDAKYETAPLHERSMISHEKAVRAMSMAVGAGVAGGLAAGAAVSSH